jgi:peptidoglycan/LPS O-acetylase OafA/YrhL
MPAFWGFGTISVRVFFALSGYFVTIWFWETRLGETGSGGLERAKTLGAFHGRRLLRIVPPLYLSILIGAVFSVGDMRDDFGWHLSFMSNFYVLNTGYWPPAVSHLWSLSVQEQFYLCWSLVLVFTPAKRRAPILILAIGSALAYRFFCIYFQLDPLIRWTMLPGSLDSFAAGAIAAIVTRGKVGGGEWKRAEKVMWALIGVTCLVGGRLLRWGAQGTGWLALVETFEAVFIFWLIVGTSRGWGGWTGRILASKPFVYVGKIALGIYLFHILVHIFFGPVLDEIGLSREDSISFRVVVLVGLSILSAAVSWELLEKPLSKFKPRRPRSKSL